MVHPISPLLFTCNFVWVDATPEKRVLPASGDTDNRHRLPTHAAGGPQVSPGASLPGGVAIRGAYPRRRRAPCLGGSCRRVATLPYKPVCGVRLMKLCARRDFVACLDQSDSTNRLVWECRLHMAARPPQTGCPASTGISAADGHPTGQARPWRYLGPASSVDEPSVQVVHVSGGRKNAFFGGCARGCVHPYKIACKSEGGMGCNRVVQKSRGANPAVLGPAKRDLASKTNPEGDQNPSSFSAEKWCSEVQNCHTPRSGVHQGYNLTHSGILC